MGYLEPAFNEDDRPDDWRQNDHEALEQLRALGIRLEPFQLPDLPTDVASVGSGAESAAFFDELLRSGRDALLTRQNRANGFRRNRLIPAVEFLQSQRVRTIVMHQFAEVISGFDVYVAPYMHPRPPADDESERGAEARQPAPSPPPRPPSAIRDHFSTANLCGYPAVSVPHGFTTKGTPTGITFMGRLYAEAEVLAVAKAYQDAAGWTERRPTLDG